MGFLDGREGAIYHGLRGFWYCYLVDDKVEKFRREIDRQSSNREKLSRLSSLTGLKLPNAED